MNGNRLNGKSYNRNGDMNLEIKDGNGKEEQYNYFYGKLVFEGEYINGEKNGKGKEYNYFYGNIEFEGEYLNGKRWNGIIKEYDWETDELIFEGMIIEGEIIENY